MNTNPVLYIAGPMSGYPESNYPAFFAAEEELRKVGYDRILNPVRRIVPASSSWHAFMRSGLRMLLDAEALVMLPGWDASRGANWERDTALRLGMPAMELPEWIERASMCGQCRTCNPGWMSMYLCASCGNKRCPHATDCRNTCTGSNDSGQPGSVYGGVA
jgi:hypothetical protein